MTKNQPINLDTPPANIAELAEHVNALLTYVKVRLEPQSVPMSAEEQTNFCRVILCKVHRIAYSEPYLAGELAKALANYQATLKR